MDFIEENIFLRFNSNTLEEVRRDVNLDGPGEMKKALRILQEWIRQQPHFKKKDLPPAYLESYIVGSKGSIERAKTRIDRMFTMRTLHARLRDNRDALEQHRVFKDKMFITVLPKLTAENYRIIFGKITCKAPSQTIMDPYYRVIYKCFDYLKLHDYNSGLVLIVDMTQADIQDILTNFNFIDLKTFCDIYLESYGFRLKRLHLITPSKIAEMLVKFCKSFVSKKIFDRCVVNKTTEELQQNYPKDMLPKDYGGNEIPLVQLQDEVILKLCTEVSYKEIISLREATVDESLRPQGQFSELYAGVTGTFRALSVD